MASARSHPGELPLEGQPRVLLDDALADCIGYLVAAEAEHIDGCAGRQEVGVGTGFEADAGGVAHGDRVCNDLAAMTLDHIDEIVWSGVNLNPADTSYGGQVLQPALRRR